MKEKQINCLNCKLAPKGMNLYGPNKGEVNTPYPLRACVRLKRPCRQMGDPTADDLFSLHINQLLTGNAAFEPEGV